MKLKFINKQEFICPDLEGLDQLTDLQKAQLKIAYRLYGGVELDNPHDMFGEDQEYGIYGAEYWDVLDAETNQLKYQFWMINSDSGTVFHGGLAKETGVEMIQTY